MLRLIGLRLTSFRSFSEPGLLTLNQQGLVYVTGHNAVEPALGANGCGKSTLFEAVCWVLYGKTSLGLRAGDIAPWQGDTAKVVLSFEVDGHEYSLRRVWSPVTLELCEIPNEYSPVTQEQVEELIGYSFETFLFAVMHAQFGEYFSDLPPSRQLEVYTEVLDLDLWERLGEMAAASALETEKEALPLELKAQHWKGRLREKERALDRNEELECAWWREHAHGLRAAWQEHKTQVAALRDLTAEFAKIKTVDVQDLQTQLVEAVGTEKTAYAACQQAARQITDLRKQGKLPPVCPTCKQKVDHNLLTKWTKAELFRLGQEVEEQDHRIKLAKTIVANKSGLVREAQEKDQSAARLRAEIKALQKEVSSIVSIIENEAQKDCPYDTEQERGAYDILVEEFAEAEEKIDALRQRVSDLRFWVTGFREIRLALIKSSLAQFEATTNSVLAALGLGEWSIEYAVEAETKGGKLKKGFNITVHSPYNKSAVPFAAWSGGESQRLRLAIAMALSDLIQDFAGNVCNVEIFDEPTAHLSDDGIALLLEVLAERAANREGATFLADHRVLDFGGFAQTIVVAKTENGSELQEA